MLFVPNDNGTAIGNIVASIARENPVAGVEIHLLDDRMVTFVRFAERAGDGRTASASSESPRTVRKRASKRRRVKSGKSVKSGRSGKAVPRSSEPVRFTYEGESLTAREWAAKLGVTENTVRYRMAKSGNPYGRKGPTDRDKVIAGIIG